MNTVRKPNYFVLLLLSLCLTLGPALRAQEQPPAAPEAPALKSVTPEAPVAPVVPEKIQPMPEAAPSAEVKPNDKTEEMRELIAADSDAVNEDAATMADADQGSSPVDAKNPVRPSRRDRRSGNSERVSFGSNSSLAEGERADSVVSIFGSSTSAGEVDDAVVSILGGSRVTAGTVGDSVVSILGNTYVNGHVKGEVVTILGNVELGPNAVIDGELICIGGFITRDAKAVVKGTTQNIAIAGHHFNFDGVTIWFNQCLLYGRPLAWDHHLGWAWVIAFGFLGFYVLIALIAPTGVNKCMETLEQHPGYSLLTALLTMLLTPVAYILLLLTMAIAIGFVLIPLFSLGLFFAAVFGKIVMLAWLGRRFTKLMGDGPLAHPAAGVLIGGLIVLGLYTIPVVGFIVYKLLAILGLGVVVYTLILQFKASRPVKPLPPTIPAGPGVAVDSGAASPPVINPVMASTVPPVISAATLPRAGFWLRLGAVFLDLIMWGVVMGLTSNVLHGWLSPGGSLPFWFSVYCIAMWATKGTTIGGIICGLKVVRLDDRPIDWGVAIVRGLGGFLSLAAVGIGFIWVAFDDEKQSWHDKIAGTTIVKVPKGTALI